MKPFELALHLVTGVELDPALAQVQQEFPARYLEPGWLDKRVILQDRIWINRDLQVFGVEEMSPVYRSNVIRFLLDQEACWLLEATGWVCLETALGCHTPEAARARIQALGLLAPGWTVSTPLVRRLLDLNATQMAP